MILRVSVEHFKEGLFRRGMGTEHLDQFSARLIQHLLRQHSSLSISYSGCLRHPAFETLVGTMVYVEHRTARLISYLEASRIQAMSVKEVASRFGAIRTVELAQGTENDSEALRKASSAIAFYRLQRDVWQGPMVDIDGDVVEKPQAVLLLGGDLTPGPGFLPRAADELAYALQAPDPKPAIFLVGGFGGAVGRICHYILNPEAEFPQEFLMETNLGHLGLLDEGLGQQSPEFELPPAGEHYASFHRLLEGLRTNRNEWLRNGLPEDYNNRLMVASDFLDVSGYLDEGLALFIKS